EEVPIRAGAGGGAQEGGELGGGGAPLRAGKGAAKGGAFGGGPVVAEAQRLGVGSSLSATLHRKNCCARGEPVLGERGEDRLAVRGDPLVGPGQEKRNAADHRVMSATARACELTVEEATRAGGAAGHHGEAAAAVIAHARQHVENPGGSASHGGI